MLCGKHKLDGEWITIFDPNAVSAEGNLSLSTPSITKNGSKMALTLQEKGSDWRSGELNLYFYEILYSNFLKK